MATPRELPTFRGYTVDERLKEFRKAEHGKTLEFIPFDSPKGQEILKEMESQTAKCERSEALRRFPKRGLRTEDLLNILGDIFRPVSLSDYEDWKEADNCIRTLRQIVDKHKLD
jgi:hypothetical protein